jgi:N-methylhydantoinase B
MAPPGGAGYGDPFRRPVDAVLADVVSGYVSLESAERDYGVVIRDLGRPDQLVRLSEHYAVDEEATARLRASRAVAKSSQQGRSDASSHETGQLL